MRMKKYQASSMAEAFAAIRAELGPDAVIVHSSEMKRGPLGILSRPMFEVVAAVDERASARSATANRPSKPSGEGRLLPPRPANPAPSQPRLRSAPAPSQPRAGSEHASDDRYAEASRGRASRQSENARSAETAPEKAIQMADVVRAIVDREQKTSDPTMLREMQQHVVELRRAIGRLMQNAQWPGMAKLAPPLVELYQRLLEQEVEAPLAQELVTTIDGELSLQAASNRATVLDSLSKHLRRMLPANGTLTPVSGEPTVLFLVGPTGVGKTTTIAKLAASLAGQRNKIVLVTCDTYRIAAIPQLRTYADILRVPIEVAYSPDELTSKVSEHLDADFIIVDTPGRSQRNADQLAELRHFVMAVPTRKTFLTVTAGSRYRDMQDIVSRFGTIPFDVLLITKLDETTTFGPILNLVRHTGKPVTYLTNGQNVPHDIVIATSGGLTDLLIGAAYASESESLAPERLAGVVA